MKTRRQFAITLVAFLALATGPAIAQSDSGIQLDAVAEIEVEVVDEQGEKQVQRQEASLVVPGDEVIYTINYVNSGAEPVADVVITNPPFYLLGSGRINPDSQDAAARHELLGTLQDFVSAAAYLLKNGGK